MSLEETLSTIPQIPIYTKAVSSRDTFYNSKKLDLFEKTLSTIPQNPICIKNYGNDFKAKDVSLQHKFEFFYCVWKLWKVSLEETLLVQTQFF